LMVKAPADGVPIVALPAATCPPEGRD